MTAQRRPRPGTGTPAPRPARIERKEGHEVIEPPVSLRHAIDRSPVVGFDHEAIARAEKALADLSANFPAWMGDEVAALLAARAHARVLHFAPAATLALFHAAHDIKGEAETLGYPLAGAAAASLCRLIEGATGSDRLPAALVDQHVDAIRALVRERDAPGAAATGRRLVERLNEVVLDYLGRIAPPPAATEAPDDPYPDAALARTD